MQNEKFISWIWLVGAALLCVSGAATAGDNDNKVDIPYKIVEGRQYEICNVLLPIINSMPHGSLRENPELLAAKKDFKFPRWKLVKDKKYIDLHLNESRSPVEFSKEKYPENYARYSDAVARDEFRLYIAKLDVDNTGVAKPVLRLDEIRDGKVHGLLYRFAYFVYDEKTMEPSEQYGGLIPGAAFFYKGRTFRLGEFVDSWDQVEFWSLYVSEPYADKSRPQLKTPPIIWVCKFSAR